MAFSHFGNPDISSEIITLRNKKSTFAILPEALKSNGILCYYGNLSVQEFICYDKVID
jgi:hypothetical protein